MSSFNSNGRSKSSSNIRGSRSSSSLSALRSSSSVNGLRNIVERDNESSHNNDNEIDLIYDEDLNDVDNDVSLGNSGELSDDPDLSEGTLEFEVCGDSQPDYPRGYIDDAIVDDVMRSADDRLNEKKSCSFNKVVAYCLGITALMMIIIGLSLTAGRDTLEKIRIEENIKEKGTAFNFDDRDEYVKPVDETPVNETPVDETTDAGTAISPNSILTKKIPMDNTTVFPPWIEHYLVNPMHRVDAKRETPFFWQVPFAGGVFQSFITRCSKKVLASNHKLANNDTMKIHIVEDSPYVNVDLSTTIGIEMAAKFGLSESGLADVIVSNRLHLTTSAILDATHRGLLFTALRHPVDRTISEYHYVVLSHNDFFVKTMTLDEFVSSRLMETNWMTRSLINKQQVPLTSDDVQLAKEILRRRCLIGLHEHIDLSIDLFEQYFGWTAESEITEHVHGYSAKEVKVAVRNHESCKRDVLSIEHSQARDVYAHVGKIKPGSAVYKKIAELNAFDMELYWYANDLFVEQHAWFINK